MRKKGHTATHNGSRKRKQSSASRNDTPGKKTTTGSKHSVLPEQSRLCKTCQTIDFLSIREGFATDSDPGLGYNIRSLSHVEPESDCSLCQFLFRIANGATTNPRHLRLRAYSARKLFEFKTRTRKDVVVLSCVPQRNCLGGCCRHEGVQRHYFGISSAEGSIEDRTISIRDTSGPIDWTLVKNWVDCCEGEHEACRATLPEALHGLTVIDCETRELLPLPHPETPFVTLSYVWGQSNQDVGIHTTLPKVCPQLIEDSLCAVTSLGLRYIWIDRYCIPQKPEDETGRLKKQTLLQEMGRIYASSYLTLIAAAGSSPDDGIPGISVLPRSNLRPLRMNDYVLAPVQGDFRSTIINSKWHSRGWTYQEALHARRRLLSSKGGLYFQCQQTRFIEDISIPAQIGTSGFQFTENESITIGQGPLMGAKIFPDLLQDDFAFIKSCVRDFSRRDFTRDDDVVDAFRGTLQTFETTMSVSNLCGVSFYSPEHAPANRTRAEYLVNGLLWKTTRYKPRQIWSNTRASGAEYSVSRRVQFPSWSWAGWKFRAAGTACWLEPALREGQIVRSDTRVQVEFSDGCILDWENDWQAVLTREKRGYLAVFLHLQAWCIDLEARKLFVTYDDPKRPAMCVLGATVGVLGFKMWIRHDVEVQELVHSLCKIVLLTDGEWDKGSFLLLRKVPGKEIFERIGTGYKLWETVDGKDRPFQVPYTEQDKRGILQKTGAKRETLLIG